MSRLLFKEIQYNRPLLLITLCVPLLIFLYGIYQQIVLQIPFGDKPASNIGLIIITVSYALFLIFIFCIKLETIINNDSIIISYIPFFKNKIHEFTKIKSIEVQKYSPLFQYLGHGYRVGFDGSSAYTVNGNYAILVLFKDGSKIRIGTQQVEKVKAILSKIDVG